MGFGWNAGIQRHGDGGKDCIFIMMQDQGQYLDHLSIAARITQQVPLQSLEVLGKLAERCSVAQSSRFALDHCQIMPPVINSMAQLVVGAINDALVFAYDLPLGDDQEAIGIDT